MPFFTVVHIAGETRNDGQHCARCDALLLSKSTKLLPFVDEYPAGEFIGIITNEEGKVFGRLPLANDAKEPEERRCAGSARLTLQDKGT